jgi:FAD synthetase
MGVKILGRLDQQDTKRVRLDRKDLRMLGMLARDSRVQLKAMGMDVGLSKDAVAYRIRRMQDQGVILRFIPQIDLTKLGYSNYHIFLLLDDTKPERCEDLLDFLMRHPNVKSIIEYSNRWDLEIVVVARDNQEFASIATAITSLHPDIILEKNKMAVIRIYSSDLLPPQFAGVLGWETGEEEVPRADDVDLQILKELSQDCRQSTYDIGKRIGISPDTVGYRIRRLQASGIIRRFTVMVKLSRLDLGWYTFAIQTRALDHRSEMRFKEYITRQKSVFKSFKTLGNWDLLLYLAADSHHAFHSTVRALKSEFASVIKNCDTWIANREYFYTVFPRAILGKGSDRKVLVFGTFDVLHRGHLDFFRQAREYGKVVAVVARDSTVLKVKGKPPLHGEEERLLKVQGIVGTAMLGRTDDMYRIIEDVKPDIICLGYDQVSFTKDLKKELKRRALEVKVLRLRPYKPHVYKSSKMRSSGSE